MHLSNERRRGAVRERESRRESERRRKFMMLWNDPRRSIHLFSGSDKTLCFLFSVNIHLDTITSLPLLFFPFCNKKVKTEKQIQKIQIQFNFIFTVFTINNLEFIWIYTIHLIHSAKKSTSTFFYASDFCVTFKPSMDGCSICRSSIHRSIIS